MWQRLPTIYSQNPFQGELSDEQFRSIFTQNICYSVLNESAIIAITDTNGVIKFANHAFAKLSKFPLDELLGANHRILNSAYHPTSFFADMYRDISKGKKWRGEIRNRAKDGSIYWVDTTIMPMHGARAKILGYAAIRIDITARKEAEAACQASEERFRDFTSAGSDWFWELDSSYKFTEVSSGISQAGLDAGFFLGKRPSDLPVEFESEFQSELASHREFRNQVMKIPATASSAARWLSLSGKPLFDSEKRLIGFRGVGRCVTAQYLAEKETRERAILLQAIKRGFPGGFAVINEDMKVIESNTEFRTLLKLPDHLFQASRANLEDILRFHALRGDYGPGDIEDIVAEKLKRTRHDKRSIYEREAADGTVLEIRSSPLREGGWVRTYVDITDRRRTELKVRHLADHDPLTGLPNRRMLSEKLKEVIALTRGTNEWFALLLVDLDEFKEINDTYGHATGDELLMEVATRLTQCVRSEDTIARIGGDEFAIIVKSVHHLQAIKDFAARIISEISQPYIVAKRKLTIGVSIGISLGPQDGKNATKLFKKADLALYQAKASGRGVCQLFDAKLQTKVVKQIYLARDLRRAAELGQLELYYQPQIALTDGAIVGFEALLRWNHPARGIVSPENFISIAERNGTINKIGEWALRNACLAAVGWPAHIKVAVNVSPCQLADPDFLKKLDRSLAESGLAPHRLEIEITESVIVLMDSKTLALLNALQARGITLAMDDFGTGYSSLTTLREFHFDKIKIERSFLTRLPDCTRSLAVLRAIVSLGRALGTSTLAEGVESKEQLDLVRDEGCSEAQGYLIGRPKPLSNYAGIFDVQHSIPLHE